jgi:hypothetical protein
MKTVDSIKDSVLPLTRRSFLPLRGSSAAKVAAAAPSLSISIPLHPAMRGYAGQETKISDGGKLKSPSSGAFVQKDRLSTTKSGSPSPCVAAPAVGEILNRVWTRIKFWLTTRRVCVWCKPPHRIGGNPFARGITGGMCRMAQARLEQEVKFLDHVKRAWTAEEVYRLVGGLEFMSGSEQHTRCVAAAQAKLEALGEDRAEVGSRGGKPAAEMEV